MGQICLGEKQLGASGLRGPYSPISSTAFVLLANVDVFWASDAYLY